MLGTVHLSTLSTRFPERGEPKERKKYPTLHPYAAGGYFSQYKIMQKSWKIIETSANGYSSESILSKSSMNTNMTGLRWFSEIFASLYYGWNSLSIGRLMLQQHKLYFEQGSCSNTWEVKIIWSWIQVK